jgi:hypothetical protein
VRVLHRDLAGGFTCDSFQKRLACREGSHWLVRVGGKEHGWDALTTALRKEAMREPRPPMGPGELVRVSERRVTIRADPLAPYGHVQKVIESCASVGVYKVEVAPL